MTEHANILLEITIGKLIESQREGDYWDFKTKHHDNNADLVKDVICLANTIRHQGDRYIIFGVNNRFKIVGVTPEGRKTQTNILDTLSKAGFVGNLYPDVYLKQILIDEKELDILVIKDIAEKPFYLQREYADKGKKLNAGTIYTRVRDMNTSSDQVASASDIEKMWRERFGLDATPFDRLKKYLLDFENWIEIEEKYWYYKPFPEFTITRGSEIKRIEAEESWVRGAINPEAFFMVLHCKYHQTVLWKGEAIFYDEMRGFIPNPDINIIDGAERWNHFYSFCMNDFKFLLLQFMMQKSVDFFRQSNPFNSRGSFIPIIIFKSEIEKDRFRVYVEEHLDEFLATKHEEIIDHLCLETRITEKDIEVLKFCSSLKNFYFKWISKKKR